MNRDESIALFKQGRDAWNAWAEQKLAERRALEDEGRWFEEGPDKALTSAAKAWREEAASDFSEYAFEGEADFSRFLFPESVQFEKATFEGVAGFGLATFKGSATFWKATFTRSGHFQQATFSDDAVFLEATFTGRAVFAAATFSDDAVFLEVTFKGSATFAEAIFKGSAWFQQATCTGDALFGQATFMGSAWFEEATFNGRALFQQPNFKGSALFRQATFKGDATFWEATFKGGAEFRQATFAGDVWFGEATFTGDALFGLCRFSGATEFSNAKFQKVADFSAIEGESAFSLARTTFQAVPDFIQAHFSEAPRCDDLDIAAQGPWPRSLADVKEWFKGDPDLPARWRALKRLAIQGHDHENEQIFFKGELLARRWHADKPWHAAFWFGVLYQWLSDFGRSLLRPLFWWGSTLVVFAGVYLSQHPVFQMPKHSFRDWVNERVMPSENTTLQLQCIYGGDSPMSAAFDLSIRNALLFVGQTSRDKLRQNYACLYGAERAETSAASVGGKAVSLSPNIPGFVVLMGHLQNVISAVLIFLFLLGIRNHFKIK